VEKHRDEDLKDLDAKIEDAADRLAAETDKKTKADLKRQIDSLNRQKVSAAQKWKEAQRKVQSEIDKTARQFAKERATATTAGKTAAAERAAALAALLKVAPDPDPLGDIELELHNIEADADTAETIEIDRALRPQLKSGGLKQWLKTVVDADHPFFDQPKAVVDGLNSVLSHPPNTGNVLQSGHHWSIAPRGILDSDAIYRASLDRDMGSRDLDNLRRVLSVMAESEGGRALLFGPPAKHDKTFDDALEARLKALNTSTQAVLDQVKAQVITPYESLGGESGKLLRQLRDRGYYITP
jgi:hypothetical protein